WVSSVGSFVDRFERDLAAITGAAHAVATSNGTSALHVCLLLAGVRPGDEVLMPTLTFIATANAVSYAGATPHFVDSEPTSLGVDAAKLDAHLRDVAAVVDGVCTHRRTGAAMRALVVMHVFGHPCDLDALAEVAALWKLVLVEDAAESLGSTYHGQHTGNVGALSALSFNGNKVVTTGGGGAVLSNDAALAKRAKHLTTTARTPHRWSFFHDEVGYNYRLPNLNAALGCAQLERLASFVERKRRLAARYRAALAGVAGASFFDEPPQTASNYWLNAVVLDPARAGERDALLAALNDARYMARPLWTLMHRLPMYAACPRGDLAVAEQMEARVVNVPSSARLGD
ncbi:MAG TPA: LegC family aminotransferase, partial [Caldimonas sp.]|nr:LegC family aminotransferase [Caldimonas sp.]